MRNRTERKFDEKLNTILQNQIAVLCVLNTISRGGNLSAETRRNIMALMNNSLKLMGETLDFDN